MSQDDFEKLGVFYLGRNFDLQQKLLQPDLCLYDSKDLVTHGVCIGMTGSGKTGLCISLLEEAIIDGIPVIAIDPKGDIANLKLTFPNLLPADFEPWVDADQARRNNISPSDLAGQESDRWRRGLAQWNEDGQRIKRLQDAADITIYTPGSTAGVPIAIIKSFAAPPDTVLNDSDNLQTLINSTVTSLLGLLGIDGDPLQSREHILLSNIFSQAWQSHQDLSITTLIQLIQKPPFMQIGALDLESFFPGKQRFELSLRLNNLLASPGFQTWLQGQALDINKLLYKDNGQPRVAIFSIAHLDDSQRMFFVSLLLNQLVAWMRAQSGTASLRALLYMDEIFGYFPPVANPPSKTPLLTLLKQGRAFGLGVLLATQNPVDLDYKGLANTGTWFIGKLQTERDKMRVLDGLEGAAASSGTVFDRQQLDRTMSSLGNRVFLMNNVHDDHPQIFQSRWSLSYLRGPLTREQIKLLTKEQQNGAAKSEQTAPDATSSQIAREPAPDPAATKNPGSGLSATKPILPPGIPEYFLPVRAALSGKDSIVYKPTLLAIGNIRFTDAKTAVDTTLQYSVLSQEINDTASGINWSETIPAKVWAEDLLATANPAASYASTYEKLPAQFSQTRSFAVWTKEFANWLAVSKKVNILKSESTGQYSKPRETERDFRVRLSQFARESRDASVANLKTKYAPKLATLQEKLRRAEQALERQQMEARNQQIQSAISVGSTMLGALMSKRANMTTINRAGTAARRVGQSMRQQQDVDHANETLESLSAQLEQLNLTFNTEMQALAGKFDPAQTPLTEIALSAKKSNVTVALLTLAWAPYIRKADAQDTAAWLKPVQ